MVFGRSIRAIAASLGRAPSTVSREIQRNEGPTGYRATHADQAAWDRAPRPKVCKLALHRALSRRVADKLQQQWSPEQIAGWLKRTSPDDTSCQMSHETIYRTLYIQSRGALKKELLAHLRHTRAMRRSRHHTQMKHSFTVMGTPASGRSTPFATARSTAFARSRAQVALSRDEGAGSFELCGELVAEVCNRDLRLGSDRPLPQQGSFVAFW